MILHIEKSEDTKGKLISPVKLQQTDTAEKEFVLMTKYF